MELKFVGGVYGGNIKPTPFLCLTLKMLQIQPEKDIIVEFIKNEDFKLVCKYCSICIQFVIFLFTLCCVLHYWSAFSPSRYVRLLGAMYMRLTGTSVDCYKYLEPLYNDYRKVKSQNRNGGGHFLEYLVGMWHDIIYSCWKRHLQITFLLYRVWVDACWWVYRWAASCRANVWHHPP